MADFLIAYNITNANEGGYSNDLSDAGGETYAGISRKNFPHWFGWNIIDSYKPLKEGQILADSNLKLFIMRFYHDNFWMPINGDSIPLQELANTVYDASVNMGVYTALQLLKQSQ